MTNIQGPLMFLCLFIVLLLCTQYVDVAQATPSKRNLISAPELTKPSNKVDLESAETVDYRVPGTS